MLKHVIKPAMGSIRYLPLEGVKREKIKRSKALTRLRKVELPAHESLEQPKRNLEFLVEGLENESLRDEEFFRHLSNEIGKFRDTRKKHASDLFTEDANVAMIEVPEIGEEVR